MQTKELTRIALFTALMALLSQIIIPLPGAVPISLSTLGVMLCGGLLPPRRAFTAQLCYLLLGLVGAPVFSGFGGGPGWLLGPTGGYLLSYPLMALVIGLLMARFSALPKWGAFLPGLFVCYLLGTGWLAFSTRCGFGHALAVGVLPFLLPDFLKVMLATVLVKGLAALSKQ